MATAVSGARRRASTALLVIGYPLSVVAGRRILRVLRERDAPRFLAMEAGIACVTAGLVLRRRWLSAAANGLSLVGAGLAWVVSGRWLR
ncbi:MAG: hypothetical protein ABR540_16965 [Acidimicrobiales bacterium]|nr:hypothetical protein [Actinomycetota bacterium]